jgi:hypothetical protein
LAVKLESGKENHISRSDIQPEVFNGIYEVRVVERGGFNISFEKALADIDITPYLNGLPDTLDSCPHWGFLIKGKIIVRYKDHEEIINSGEAYYMAPGHTVFVTKGSETIEFSPKLELDKTMAIIAKNMELEESKTSK